MSTPTSATTTDAAMTGAETTSAGTAALLTDDGPVSPTVRGRLRANRGILVIGVVLLVVSVLLALARSTRVVGELDPDATDKSGSHALATLLRDQGVTVVRVTDTAAAAAALAKAPDATLVVTPRAPVSERMAAAIRSVPVGHLVLLGPDAETLDRFAPWAVQDTGVTSTDEVAAGCSWPVAGRAGAIPATGLRYTSAQSSSPAAPTGPGGATDRAVVTSCWDGAVLVAAPTSTDPDTLVIGAYPALTNDSLASSGNAAMALGALGASTTVVWWLPSETDPLQFQQAAEPSIEDLVPSWVGWAFLQVVLAMVVVVWWRGRRLGRIVLEPLPVVVRATETIEGRARLYRRGHARGRASDILREAALGRLRVRLSLPRSADAGTVVAAVAARTGRPDLEVAALLKPGNSPTDDASLARLADELDILENEVRRS